MSDFLASGFKQIRRAFAAPEPKFAHSRYMRILVSLQTQLHHLEMTDTYCIEVTYAIGALVIFLAFSRAIKRPLVAEEVSIFVVVLLLSVVYYHLSVVRLELEHYVLLGLCMITAFIAVLYHLVKTAIASLLAPEETNSRRYGAFQRCRGGWQWRAKLDTLKSHLL
ncbi:hypothetical protein C8R43DRAFT_944104 [Mycena crocata]|nr:hypothetical protein C8R43DRAFT_944104 [Mycena crocata]